MDIDLFKFILLCAGWVVFSLICAFLFKYFLFEYFEKKSLEKEKHNNKQNHIKQRIDRIEKKLDKITGDKMRNKKGHGGETIAVCVTIMIFYVILIMIIVMAFMIRLHSGKCV